MKKKLLTVLALIVGVTLSSTAQTVTTHLFESNLQESLNYDGESFSGSGNYYQGTLQVELSPHEVSIKRSGEMVFKEVLIPASRDDLEKWVIYGFYSSNNRGMVITVLINKAATVKETGNYGMIWVTERNGSASSGVSLLLTKSLGSVTRNVTMSLGLEE